MSKKLLITRYQNGILTTLTDEMEAIEFHYEEENREKNILGNIYIGRVKNVVKNIDAAFIQFTKDAIGYYSIKENKMPLFLNLKQGKNLLPCLGDLILVQVSKENSKTKAPTLTSHINLTGKYVVLTVGIPYLSFSSKITDHVWKRRCREQLHDFITERYGCIVRTNAQNQEFSVIEQEWKGLVSLFEQILREGEHQMQYTCLYQAHVSYLSNLRDVYTKDLEGILTDEQELYEEAKQYLQMHQPEDIEKLSFYKDALVPLKSIYNLEKQLMRALTEKVYLKSGGYLVIEPTEALVVIDVNTGKFMHKKNIEETALFINKEASKEIAKQLRLRNLSGIIIVDFINMPKKEHQEELMEVFRQYLSKDPIKTVLEGISKLNLVELTRKKVRKPLSEQMGIKKQCENRV